MRKATIVALGVLLTPFLALLFQGHGIALKGFDCSGIGITGITPPPTNGNKEVLWAAPIIVSGDESCLQLPRITAAGSVFFSNMAKYQRATSGEADPPFFMASQIPDKIPYHIAADVVHFELIREHLFTSSQLISNATTSTSKLGTAYDIGANQGFYTYFLATLGFQVHAFEIMQDNFEALQHGLLYNSKQVSDRVHLYPMGVSSVVKRMTTQGSHYSGFLKENSKGSLLSISMDCLAHHVGLDAYVPFVKIDVEGFEIDVLKGAHQSLSASTKIGALLMEVGPSRWNRAQVSLGEGIAEMITLAERFANSFLLVRDDKDKSCNMAKIQGSNITFDPKPPARRAVKIMQLQDPSQEMKPLLTEMYKTQADCNFWFTNPPPR